LILLFVFSRSYYISTASLTVHRSFLSLLHFTSISLSVLFSSHFLHCYLPFPSLPFSNSFTSLPFLFTSSFPLLLLLLLLLTSLVQAGRRSLSDALDSYEQEMSVRSAVKVLKSRAAAVSLHSPSALASGNETRASVAENALII
jgi:hypothetical protein